MTRQLWRTVAFWSVRTRMLTRDQRRWGPTWRAMRGTAERAMYCTRGRSCTVRLCTSCSAASPLHACCACCLRGSVPLLHGLARCARCGPVCCSGAAHSNTGSTKHKLPGIHAILWSILSLQQEDFHSGQVIVHQSSWVGCSIIPNLIKPDGAVRMLLTGIKCHTDFNRRACTCTSLLDTCSLLHSRACCGHCNVARMRGKRLYTSHGASQCCAACRHDEQPSAGRCTII